MTLWQSVWIVALALAAAAPWFVRALSERFEARVRSRTEALVLRAKTRGRRDESAGGPQGGAESGQPDPGERREHSRVQSVERAAARDHASEDSGERLNVGP